MMLRMMATPCRGGHGFQPRPCNPLYNDGAPCRW